ncbi:MAG: P-loop NTPase, partial [Lachnospiraceae bacterium]|nr:P-loop NTPase [Lachnospiraceae bacterium]
PQDLVSMVVAKAVNMAKMMNVPILGIVENYSYFTCPDCGKQHAVFGESKIEEVAAHHVLPVLAKLPIDPDAAKVVDMGLAEQLTVHELDGAVERVEAALPVVK